MRTFTTRSDYVQRGKSCRSREVYTVSMSSGKCCLPRIRRNSCSYVNKFNSLGSAEVVTEISEIIPGSKRMVLRVAKRGISGEPEIVFQRTVSAQAVLGHILEDLKNGNHRLYRADSPARSRNGRTLEFSDGVSMLLRGVERMTGVDMNSRFVDMGRNVGCRTNFPTLEKVVHGQASRHVRVRRPAGSKSFASGMPTTAEGGAKMPSLKEQVGRNMQAARRNLGWAEEAHSKGNTEEAEERFKIACEYETKASESRSVLSERKALLRERVAKAREAKAVKKAAQSAA